MTVFGIRLGCGRRWRSGVGEGAGSTGSGFCSSCATFSDLSPPFDESAIAVMPPPTRSSRREADRQRPSDECLAVDDETASALARLLPCPARGWRRRPTAAGRRTLAANKWRPLFGRQLRRRLLERHAHRLRRARTDARAASRAPGRSICSSARRHVGAQSRAATAAATSMCCRSRSNSASAWNGCCPVSALEQDHADRVDVGAHDRPARPAACSGDM